MLKKNLKKGRAMFKKKKTDPFSKQRYIKTNTFWKVSLYIKTVENF